MYGHWATVIMVFIAGLGGVSLFALGYILLAFMILWKGTTLYTMKNYRRTLLLWKTILLYNVIVMFFKVALQVRNFSWTLFLSLKPTIAVHLHFSRGKQQCRVSGLRFLRNFLPSLNSINFQLVGCVFVDKLLSWCSIRQLFSIVCVSTMSGHGNSYYFPQRKKFQF